MTKLLTGVVALLFTLGGREASALVCNPGQQLVRTVVNGAAPTDSCVPIPGYVAGGSVTNSVGTGSAVGGTTTTNNDAYNLSRCDNLNSQIQSSTRKVSPNVLLRSRRCQGQEQGWGESRLDSSDDDYDEESENSSCRDSLNSTTCPEENAGQAATYRDEEKEARDRKRDLEKDLIDSEEDLNRMKSESEQRMNEVNDRVEDAGEKFKKDGQDLLDQLESKIAEQDNQLRDMMNQMRAQYNKWDENYVEMRDQFRAAEQAIAQAKYSTEVQCRTEAQARLTETDKRIKERTDGLVGKKVNQSTSRVAGGKKRRNREYEQLRQTQYAEAYRMCLDGKSPAGAAVNAAIQTAKDNFARAKAKLADQQAVIENQRRQLLQSYEEAQKSAQGNKDRVAQQAQRMSQQQFESYQKSLRRAEREYQSEQRNYQNAMNTFNRRQQMTYQQMSEAQSELFTASARLSCARANGGTVSEAAGQRRLQQFDDAEAALATLESSCTDSGWTRCAGTHSKPAICTNPDGPLGSASRGRDGAR